MENHQKFFECLKPDAYSKFLIAEVAQAHDGSLGQAHSFIDLAANCGANGIKFQTHFAEEESSPLEPWRIAFSRQDTSRFDYWKRMEFTAEQWAGLKQHCDDKGLLFLSSAFSRKAVELLERLDVPAWKIASGETENHQLLQDVIGTRKPVLVSSGLSTQEEVDHLVSMLKNQVKDLVLFQCSTAYPTPPDQVGLSLIPQWKSKFEIPIGLSDHSGTPHAGLLAAALGASFVEVHICFHRGCFGPDTSSSLDPDQLKQLAEGLIFAEHALTPFDKTKFALQHGATKKIFARSFFYRRDLGSNHRIGLEDLILKKPGMGLGPAQENEVVGKILQVDVAKGTMVEKTHLGVDPV